ncbi:polysaccharide transporter, PST family [Nakamurella panacisegetis]|uniref:Polysaccharide transporter, PST family n=1 Tax=Nakamurella panacisegetis TaxID=1090615 RepID=A0A1H0IIV8_9ACTN|nr:lipopolysaccharide biosynthesis protein [Nakamurella panacisegetis]SDO31323.1 polysaccharide transporter, PST family [Nakamurella panacisegetis]
MGDPDTGSPSLGRAAASGAGITLVSQGLRFVLQIIALVVLSRLLTPSDFGLVAMVTAILGVAEIIRDFGLSSAAIQAKELSDGERTNLFWANLGIGTACAAVAAACSPLIAAIYSRPELTGVTLALSWLFVVSGANTQFRAELSRSLRFRALAVTDVGAQALGIGAGILSAVLGFGFWSIVIQQIVFVVATCAINVVSCRWRPGWPHRGISLRRFFKFGAGLLGMQVMGYATNNVDTVALGSVWGAGPVGLYSRGYQLLMVPLSQVSNALLRVVLPVLSRVQDDDETYLRYVRRAQLLCCYGFGLSFAVAAGLSGPLVAVLFGAAWSGVAPIFALLAIGGIFRGLAQTTYWITLSKGLTGSQLRFYLLARPFMIISILAGLPWGAVGVAAGHSFAFMVEWAASLWWMGRSAGIDYRPLLRRALRSVLLVCVPAGLIALAGSMLPVPAVLRLVLGALAAAGYVVGLAVVSSTERADLRLMADFVQRATGRGRP